MLKKAYVEITNVCNLSCDFCHGTKRETRFMTEEEFRRIAGELSGVTEYLYFHLMGEPLLHPKLEKLFSISSDMGFKVILTTNGTLLSQKADILLNANSLHKVSISLHCYEANSMGMSIEKYLLNCVDFCKKAADRGIITVLRLWNVGGADSLNEYILGFLKKSFPEEWKETYSGYRLSSRVFLEWGEKFDWPDLEADDVGRDHTCYGLRDQIGILCDGSVVPCCLDADGIINLGNVFEENLCDILSSPRAVKLKKSFETRNVCEDLCRRCGFAARLKKPSGTSR